VVRKEMWRNRRDLMTSIQNQERVNMMCGIFTKKYNEAYHINTFCTMMNTIQLCGIEFAPKPIIATTVTTSVSEATATSVTVPLELLQNVPNESIQTPNPTPSGIPVSVSTRKKFPRLNELYSTLFDSALPSDLHNSIVDVLVCLRCFLKVRSLPEMTDAEFQLLVETYSRPETN